MSVFKDAGHLFRFAGLFVLAFLIFLVARHYVVPKSFGQYGHYRGAAMSEIATHPAKFAGHDACETCHSDVADKKKAGKHANLHCEACHDALFQRLPATEQPKTGFYEYLAAMIGKSLPPDPPIIRHADDPTSVIPVKPDTAVICARCHTASAAKPKGFPQVVPEEHSNGLPCGTCHQPHNPGIEAGGAK